MSNSDPPHPRDGHDASCGADCRAGEDMDPMLARALADYDELTAGLTREEESRLMRHSWLDDQGGVRVRDLRSVDGEPPPPQR